MKRKAMSRAEAAAKTERVAQWLESGGPVRHESRGPGGRSRVLAGEVERTGPGPLDFVVRWTNGFAEDGGPCRLGSMTGASLRSTIREWEPVRAPELAERENDEEAPDAASAALEVVSALAERFAALSEHTAELTDQVAALRLELVERDRALADLIRHGGLRLVRTRREAAERQST